MKDYKGISGAPCLTHGCSRCCHNTEMMLTREDVERIESLGYRDFYYESDGFLYLKNKNGKCVFLGEDGKCKIYEARPYGCRFYPYIYDYKRDQILLDDDCPYANEFSLQKPQALKNLVFMILKEREERIKRRMKNIKIELS